MTQPENLPRLDVTIPPVIPPLSDVMIQPEAPAQPESLPHQANLVMIGPLGPLQLPPFRQPRKEQVNFE